MSESTINHERAQEMLLHAAQYLQQSRLEWYPPGVPLLLNLRMQVKIAAQHQTIPRY